MQHDVRNTQESLVGNLEGKKLLSSPGLRWEDIIKTYFKERS